ncbi:hypothetical protein VTL71DRAFT_7120 [Oculimacula yallundae]|uniref:C2H2-type domain-containing protein n=1 Tax=Oculimacula yallundae TaxID=86028 RepID=A0ABR4BWM0_9HELO
MDHADLYSPGFNSLDCGFFKPSPFELHAYAELSFPEPEADFNEAVTKRSLSSSFASSVFPFGLLSPADSIQTDADINEEPFDYGHEFTRPVNEAEYHTFSHGTLSSSLGSPVSNFPEQEVGQLFSCKFPRCGSPPFKKMCDFKVHLKGHAHEVLDKWTGSQPRRCSWPSCPSKALFKSPRMLMTHLENIHISPLLCNYPNCTHRTPFRSNFDLKRHLRTHSGEQGRFQCPYLECEKDPKVFVRKDKWLNHLRSSHSGDTCPLNHCEAGSKEGFQSQAETVEHIKKLHGNFECGIGSCGSGSRSRFTEFELLKHLEITHGLQYADIASARNVAKLASDRTVRSKDVPECDDCSCCRKHVREFDPASGYGFHGSQFIR